MKSSLPLLMQLCIAHRAASERGNDFVRRLYVILARAVSNLATKALPGEKFKLYPAE